MCTDCSRSVTVLCEKKNKKQKHRIRIYKALVFECLSTRMCVVRTIYVKRSLEKKKKAHRCDLPVVCVNHIVVRVIAFQKYFSSTYLTFEWITQTNQRLASVSVENQKPAVHV